MHVSVGVAGNVSVTVPDDPYRVDTGVGLGTEEIGVEVDTSAPGRIVASTGIGHVTVQAR